MSYKFWIINYADQDIPWLVSDHLIEENRDQLAELLHLNSDGFTPTYLEDGKPQPQKDQLLLKTCGINETYNSLVKIYNNATKLVRKYEKDYSMVYTDFDTSDKVSDSIDHCIWIIITATDWLQQYNGLIHIPAHELKKIWYDDYFDQWEDIFNKYQNIIKDKRLVFTWCYYWWWLIPDSTHWLYDRHKKDYQNATTKLILLWYKFFKEYPHRILWPKWKWEECIIIETQKNRWHIFRPDDDLTISNQIL